ncbi:MAG: patatin-like phospholipase family protein [Proteobacteria bacterium]|nr:patatin-like phospholipase family protein [Pseudomonadota bacterium]
MRPEPLPPLPQIVPVLAGGGTRLSAHVGALKALGELGVDYRRIVGVSGGSIVAALHANGWSPDRLHELAVDIDFGRFRGYSLLQLIFHGGLSSGNSFEQWLDGLLQGVRFKDLALDLAVVATDVRRSEPVVFDRTTTPDYPVARAVRHSMGIPLLFAFQDYGDSVLVDGSILSEDVLHRDWAGDGTPVCVFRMRSRRDAAPPVRRRRRFFPLPGYVQMLIRTFMTTLSREFVDAKHWPHTVVIDVGPHSPIDFRLSRADKEYLFRCGRETVRAIMPRKYPEFGLSETGPDAARTTPAVDLVPALVQSKL